MVIDANVVFGQWKFTEENHSIEKIKLLLEKHRIDRALIASTLGIFYDDTCGNDVTFDICKKYNELDAVGIINLSKFLDAEEEVAKRKEQGFKAFRLFNEYQGLDLEGLRFKSLIKILEKYSMPLIIRGTDLNLRSCVDKIALSTYNSSIPIIILDVSGYNLSEAIEAAKFNPNLYFSSRLFTTIQSIELFCEEISDERLVIGSGIPFYYGHQSLFRIKMANISESAREKILYKNLSRIIGIPDVQTQEGNL